MNAMLESLGRKVARRLKAARAVVVIGRNGKAGRIYDLDAYLRRAEQTRGSRPWEGRRLRAPDPLGAGPGRVISSLRRENIYGR